MKKLLYLFLTIFLIACGSQQSTNISSDTSKETSMTMVTAQSIVSQMEGAKYKEGELLVKFKSGVVSATSLKAHKSIGASLIKRFRIVPNLEHIKLPEGLSVKDAVVKYMSDPDVEYAEPNYIRRIASIIPNDTFFKDQWALHNTGTYANGTFDADIDAPEGWDVTTGNSSVIVAVLDTGIDYNHADLVNNIWINTGETSCTDGIDNDGNGFIDDCKGWDFIGSSFQTSLDDNDPVDENGHGTHVAGTIGAAGNNGVGISGVMWTVRLMPVKALDANGEGTDAELTAGIQYAVSNGAKIINASLGGPGFSNSVLNAISSANTAGALFVAAAGNGGDDSVGDNNDLAPFYPASYNLPNIISVAATDQNNNRVPFSNYGPTSVDVAAPGVYIISTVPNWWSLYEGYGVLEFLGGTSMAAPHVSGLAGLLWSYYYNFTYQQIISTIFSHVDVLPSLQGWILTGGKINAFGSLSSLWAPSDLTATLLSSSGISLKWTDRATAESGYKLERKTTGEAYSPIVTLGVNAGSYEDSGLVDGKRYFYAVKAFNSIGESPIFPGNETSAATPINAPTGLKATALSSSDVRLTWNDNSQSENGYKIERKVFDGEFVEVAVVTGENITSHTDSGLSPATKYWYRVRAFNSEAGNSQYSNEETVTTLATSGKKKSDNGGGGCSIGSSQNTPSAISNFVVMALPLILIMILRLKRR
ncbi:MAG: S8 family serine peptidase [Nitrospirota bacterium]